LAAKKRVVGSAKACCLELVGKKRGPKTARWVVFYQWSRQSDASGANAKSQSRGGVALPWFIGAQKVSATRDNAEAANCNSCVVASGTTPKRPTAVSSQAANAWRGRLSQGQGLCVPVHVSLRQRRVAVFIGNVSLLRSGYFCCCFDH
jgi:hypothetical protein